MLNKSLLFFVLFSFFNFLHPALLMSQRSCGTMKLLEKHLKEKPSLKDEINKIERDYIQYINSSKSRQEVTITIPVVVHVVWHNQIENISEEQIRSQIEILNEDFRRLNNDANATPNEFIGVASDVNIEFCLASVDPNGLNTTGITRTYTPLESFPSTINSDNEIVSVSHDMQFSNSGGIDIWKSSDYLNIWVANLEGRPLGYAQFPADINLNPETDGVVIDYRYIGNSGTATSPYDLGRTTTHEVGHWLNLNHIWGDGDCNQDDGVMDTPIASRANNTSEPCTFPGPNTCNEGINDLPDMFQNYMDYSTDACMNLFTNGQKNRMRALFASRGARESLLYSNGCGTNCLQQIAVNDGLEIYGGSPSNPNEITVRTKIKGGDFFNVLSNNGIFVSNVRINGTSVSSSANRVSFINENEFEFNLNLSSFNFENIQGQVVSLEYQFYSDITNIGQANGNIYFLSPSISTLGTEILGTEELPYIERAVNKGIFKGKGNLGFAPNDNLTYAEAAKIICQVGIASDPNFELDLDVSLGIINTVNQCHWAFPYVQTLINKGAITNLSSFFPDANIRYEDLCFYILQTLDGINRNAYTLNTHITYPINVTNSTSAQIHAIETMGEVIGLIDAVNDDNRDLGIAEALHTNALFDNITFDDNTFNINGNSFINRADAAVLMSNLSDFLDLLNDLNSLKRSESESKSRNNGISLWEHNMIGSKLNLGDGDNSSPAVLQTGSRTILDNESLQLALPEVDDNNNPLAFFWSIKGGKLNQTTSNKFNAISWTPPTVSSPEVFSLYIWTGSTKGGYSHGIMDITVNPSGGGNTSPTTPSIQASNLALSLIKTDQMTASWDRGNGDKVIVTCTPCGQPASSPQDGSDYGYNSNFSSAPSIGNSKIVYEGTGDNRTITGLQARNCYSFRVYEFNGTGNETKYLRTNPPTKAATTYDNFALDFVWDEDPIVVGEYIDFDWISSVGGLSTESWTFQGASPSTSNSGDNIRWFSSGTYTVTLTGTHASLGQSSTVSKEVTVVSYNDFQPDLVFNNQEVDPTTTVADRYVNVNWDVSNTGLDRIRFSYMEYYFSNDATLSGNDFKYTEEPEDYFNVYLDNGEAQSGERRIRLPETIASGTRYIILKLNSLILSNDTPESNTSNNIVAIPITINPELSDLTIENVNIAKNTLRSGEEVNTNVTFYNRGYYNNFGCANYNIYLSTDNQFSEDDNQYYIGNSSWCTNDIYAPNSPEVHSRNIVINPVTPNGSYYLLFCIDRSLNGTDNAIAELNEDNNVVAIPITISNPNQPTVQVADFQISSVNSSSITLNWTKGNGANSLIVATSEDDSNRLPIDGESYSTSTNWNNAMPFYAPNPITRFVYNGAGTQTTITNLTPDKTWYFTIYTYNGSGTNTDYLQANAPVILAHTKGGNDSNYTKHLKSLGLNDFEVSPINELVFSQTNNLTIAFGRRGRVLKSTDDCISHNFTNVTLFNDGFYAGEILSDNTVLGIDRLGKVFKSSDEGASWNQISTIAPHTSIRVYDSHYINSQTGFIVASRNSDGAGLIYKTTNGGLTWSQVYTAPSRFYHIDSNNANIWAAGKDGRIVRSYNLGENWSVVNNNLPNTIDIGNIQFLSDLIGYCNSLSTVYKTIDGGSNWTAIRNIETIVSQRTLHFINEDVGFVIGGYTNDDELLKTTDGGSTWTQVTNIDFGFISSIYAESESIVWLYGDHITKIITCTENTYYADTDNDGYGNAQSTIQACQVPVGFVNNTLDCNDDNPNINPDSEEICDNLDNDCNNIIDDNILVNPTDNLVFNNLTANSVSLNWDARIEAENYVLAYKTADAADYTFVTINSNTYELSGLEENTTYIWWIRVIGCNAASDFVRGNNFTTLSNSVICGAETMYCGNTYTGTTLTENYYNPASIFNQCGSGGLGAPNKFYKVVGNGQDITLELCNSDYDTRIDVYCLPSNSCSESANFICVGGNDDFCSTRSKLTFWARTGYDFYIMVHGFSTATGNYAIDVSCNSHCTPVSNADCTINPNSHSFTGTAKTIQLQTNPSSLNYNFEDNSCTNSGFNPSCDPYGQIQDVWYKFNTGPNKVVTVEAITMANAATNLNFAIYDACDGNEILCERSDGINTVATLNNLIVNHDYYIQVWTNSFNAGPFGIAAYIGNAINGCGAIDYVNLHDTPIPSGEYYGEYRIWSYGQVETGANVVVKAGNNISLTAGFTAKAGSNFLAQITSCAQNNFVEGGEGTGIEQPDKPGLVNNPSSSKISFNIFPNPLSFEANIQFELPSDKTCSIFITNLNGKIVDKKEKNQYYKGFNEEVFDVSDLPVGMYYITLQTNDNISSKKIIITRKY